MEQNRYFKRNQETIYTHLNNFVQTVAISGIVSSGVASMVYKNPDYLTGAAIGAGVILVYAAKRFIDNNLEEFLEKLTDKFKNKEQIKYSLKDENDISNALNEINEIEKNLKNDFIDKAIFKLSKEDWFDSKNEKMIETLDIIYFNIVKSAEDQNYPLNIDKNIDKILKYKDLFIEDSKTKDLDRD